MSVFMDRTDEGKASYEWISVNEEAPFSPRDGAGALVFSGRMWLIGGYNRGDKENFPRVCNNEVWSTENGEDWRLEKPNTFGTADFDPETDWEGRHTAGYVVFRDKMWIIGGDANQGHYHRDVWSSSDGRTWNQENREVPLGPRVLHHTLAFRNRIWVMGGQTLPQFAPAEERFHNDVWNTQDGLNWVKVDAAEPRWSNRGMIGGYAIHGTRMWIIGGGTYDTPGCPERSYYSDVWSSDDGKRWTRHAESAPWEPRQYHEVASFDGRLWVLEGYYWKNRNDVWHSRDGANWFELRDTPWKPRHAASVFVHKNALWLVAGNNMESDVWKLRPT